MRLYCARSLSCRCYLCCGLLLAAWSTAGLAEGNRRGLGAARLTSEVWPRLSLEAPASLNFATKMSSLQCTALAMFQPSQIASYQLRSGEVLRSDSSLRGSLWSSGCRAA